MNLLVQDCAMELCEFSEKELKGRDHRQREKEESKEEWWTGDSNVLV